MKTIKVKIGNLFKAIEQLENYKFINDIGYKQKSSIQIKNELNNWCQVPAMIKKQDKIIRLLFSNNIHIDCGVNHKLIKDKKTQQSILAKDIKIDDMFITSINENIVVKNINNLNITNDVFDLQINSKNHIYQTDNKLLHHNTLISGLICLAYRKHPILFIFDSIDLVHQTYNDFINELEFDEKEIGIIQGNNYKYDKDTRIILLSMLSYEKAFHIFPKIKVIISDECHITSRTETAQKIIYSCQNASIHIGLSATPDRIKNPVEQLRVYSTMGPIVYQKKIKEQQTDNYIIDTKVKIYNVSFPGDEMIEVTGNYNDVYEKIEMTKKMIETELRQEYKITIKKAKELIKEYFDEDKKIEEVENIINHMITLWCKEEGNSVIKEDDKYYFRRFLSYGDESTHYILNDYRNDLIAKVAQEQENERVLILFNKIKHGEELLKRLPNAVLIHGSHNNDERNEAEKHLKENKHAIVLASKIWGKGKNIPEIETYINAGAGVSEIEQIQKMGRSIRLSPKTGKEFATVIDFFDRFSPLAIKQSNIRLKVYQKEKLNITMID